MSSKLKKLGSLADIYQSQNLDGAITKIRLDKIHPSIEQPRRDRLLGVEDLAASLEKDGLLSPIVVTRDGDGFRIIAGERRYHAMSRLGWQEAECRIISREERDYYRISIIENLQRENLSPEEEAIALHRLKTQENYSDAELARIIGKSRNYITEILGIAVLPTDVLEKCKDAGIDNKNLLIQVVQSYKKGTWKEFLQAYQEGQIRTVRAAREFLQNKEGADTTNISDTRNIDKASSRNPSPQDRHIPSGSSQLQLKVAGSIVSIHCSSPAEARKIEKWIRENYTSTSHPTSRS